MKRAATGAPATRRRLGRAGVAMVDQVLSSGSGLVLIVLVARQADAAMFGAVNVAIIVNGFLLGVVRAAIGEVVLLRCSANPRATRSEARRGLFLTLLAGVATGLGLLGASAAVGGIVGHFLMLVALAAPFVFAQDLLRYVAYGAGRMGQAVMVDGVWLGAQILVSAVLMAAGEATPTRLVLAWALGAGAGAVAGALRQGLTPRPVGIGRWWVEERARVTGFLSDFLVSTGMVQGSFILLSVLLPLDEFGGLRLAVVAVTPLANLLAGVRTLTLAHLAGLRADPRRARLRAAQLATGFAGAAAAYGFVLVLLPDRWGSELFGTTWAKATALVGIVAAAEVLRLSTFAAIDLVKVLGAPMDLVRTRARAGVGVVAGLLLGATVAGPRGAAVCLAVGYGIATITWWRQGWAVGRHPAPHPTRARI